METMCEGDIHKGQILLKGLVFKTTSMSLLRTRLRSAISN